jgi:hypothetical protein
MSLKEQLQSDLTTAMKSRDELTASTLRMALTAITTEEVAGKQARRLSDDEVLKVLTREAKKRREAAEALAARVATSSHSGSWTKARCSPDTCPPRWVTTSWRRWSAMPSRSPARAGRKRWVRS